ncbi:diguanylate cyclase [Deinococcus gobiensis]|uniref:diguanylate cyclase n=1 Tax=Deinococcus gobiensis TaxID=502394 RepID=UPI0002FD9670|nr:diguanylate cyclase [Deinococcus gobiensis]
MSLRRLLLLSQVPFWLILLLSFALLNLTLNARVADTEQVNRTRAQSSQLASAFRQVLDMEASLRGFVIVGRDEYLGGYRTAQAALPGILGDLRAQVARNPAGLTPEDRRSLARIDRIGALATRWQQEIAQPEINLRRTQPGAAQAIVASGRGKRIVDAIRTEVDAYGSDQTARLRAAETAAALQLRRLRWMLLGLGLFVLLASVALTLTLSQWLTRALGRLSRAAGDIAQGARGVRLPLRGVRDLQQVAGAFNTMSGQLEEAREEAARRAEALARRNADMTWLGELSDWMQAARSLEEGADVLSRALPTLLPGTRGVLKLHNASRNLLLPLVSWGGLEASYQPAEGCWALRRGETRRGGEPSFAPPCLSGADAPCFSCIPLFSHGETLGTLQLSPQEGEALPAAAQQTLPALTRQLSLALAGLRLQERLRQQTIRDPLTGLFNRRHLEEQLVQAVALAHSTAQPLSLIALDVDHFKRLNDTFGHDAGDAVLVRMGIALRDLTAQHGLATRPGGEEFTVILPGMSLDLAETLAETLRAQVAGWTLTHAGTPLGQITLSLGVAELAEHGTPATLTRVADEALYLAKRSGRNRVCRPPTADVALARA